MKQFEKHVLLDCVLEFRVFLRKNTINTNKHDNISSIRDVKINTIIDSVCTIQTDIIPDENDYVTVALPDKYKNINLGYYICNRHVLNINGSNIRLDLTSSSNKLVLHQIIDVVLIESEMMKFADSNLNKPEWKDGIQQSDIVKLSIDDIIKIYHQTLHKAVEFTIYQ